MGFNIKDPEHHVDLPQHHDYMRKEPTITPATWVMGVFFLCLTGVVAFQSVHFTTPSPSQAQTFQTPVAHGKRRFVEDDSDYTEWVSKVDEGTSCGHVTKWKEPESQILGRDYKATLEFGEDQRSHSFKTLKQAEDFLAENGCKP
jgi:hypothetical protein